MGLDTTYGNDVLIIGQQTVIGTAMLGEDFGTVKSASVKRQADKEDLLNGNGNLRAVLLSKPGFELTLEVAFDASVTPPGLGERIALPLVGVTGRVMPGVEVKWEQGKERGLSIPVNSWDSMEDAPLYQNNPATGDFILLDLAKPVVTPTAGEGEIVLDWPDVEDADSYIVQVSTDSGVTWANLATPSLSTYTHTPVTTGQTRHYRVRAVNENGNGPWSATVNATAE
jgi:hypothetical protein